MTLMVRRGPGIEDRFNQLVREPRRTKSGVLTPPLLTRHLERGEPKSGYRLAPRGGVFTSRNWAPASGRSRLSAFGEAFDAGLLRIDGLKGPAIRIGCGLSS